MRIEITKRQEYVNDEPKKVQWSIILELHHGLSHHFNLEIDELKQLRDELNELKL